MKKGISVICSIIGFIVSSFGLTMGLNSIGAPGWGGLGVIFIMPSILAFILVLFDFLISIDKIKKGLTYSVISTLIKIGGIALLIPSTMYSFQQEMKGNLSNLQFDLTCIILLAIVAVPSILNTVKFINLKKQEK